MTREELFASLAKKGIPSFATSILGFTLGALIDRGATEEEVRALCAFLVDQIEEAKKNPELVATIEKFSSMSQTSLVSVG